MRGQGTDRGALPAARPTNDEQPASAPNESRQRFAVAFVAVGTGTHDAVGVFERQMTEIAAHSVEPEALTAPAFANSMVAKRHASRDRAGGLNVGP